MPSQLTNHLKLTEYKVAKGCLDHAHGKYKSIFIIHMGENIYFKCYQKQWNVPTSRSKRKLTNTKGSKRFPCTWYGNVYYAMTGVKNNRKHNQMKDSPRIKSSFLIFNLKSWLTVIKEVIIHRKVPVPQEKIIFTNPENSPNYP